MGFDVRASALKWPPLDQTPAVRPDLLSCLVSQLWLRDTVGSWSLTLALLAGAKSQASYWDTAWTPETFSVQAFAHFGTRGYSVSKRVQASVPLSRDK